MANKNRVKKLEDQINPTDGRITEITRKIINVDGTCSSRIVSEMIKENEWVKRNEILKDGKWVLDQE